MYTKFFVALCCCLKLVEAVIHPIEIQGRHFFDGITHEPFLIKGVDYQPGGSSGVNNRYDPLSNPDNCVRDIFLFQELGLNTIRVYSINPDLNHDKCMSLLAAAGIYLILDVNSPLQGQHLNRYEPWTTYSEKYMTHVYKVVNEFSGYNNTLAFFAGNEIVNDEKSASTAPPYIKGVIRDIKYFLKKNNIRSIPVGYSAADDLSYRIPLAEYLECYESDPLETVDFYGVNTYQWCGHQTFLTSGYNELVKDYSSYSKPIFFSEYGCNEVVPRVFEEISAIYSDQMTAVFSGGLVYEFVQEQNDYGLIDYDHDGNVKVLPDFNTFKSQISKIIGVSLSNNLILEDQKSIDSKKNDKNQFGRQSKVCGVQYKNLDVSKGIPKPVAESVVKKFKSEKRGKFVSLNEEDMKAKSKIFNFDGSILVENPAIRPVSKLELETNDIESSTSKLNPLWYLLYIISFLGWFF